MVINQKVYDSLVNRVPGIRDRYQQFRKKHPKKILAWSYLFFLNVQYYILRKKSIADDESLFPDKGKEILSVSESSTTLLEKPELLAEKLIDIDVISFDVFDTLILRNVNSPEDVFYLVQNDFQYPNFKQIRKDAEWQVRLNHSKEHGDYEVTFTEIWERVHAITGIDQQNGMNSEWNAELACCYANPYFLELVNKLKKYNKKMIICSDMYLNKEQIRELLHKCGYPAFDDYFISSDFRYSKNDGKLYDIIRKKYGESTSYIQIGDNEHSDIQQARHKGFKTYYYHNVHDAGDIYRSKDMSPIVSSLYSGIINGYLRNGLTQKTKEFEFGFVYGGLFVVGYCQFIHEYVENHSIDKILFLARDGDILNKIYRILYPQETEKCEYVYWSRLASTKLCARSYKSHFIERMIKHKINQGYKLADIFHTMEIDDMLSAFLSKSGNLYTAQSIFNSQLAEQVLEYVEDNWELVCRHYDDELEEGKRYYSKILKDAQSAVAVDVGWVGSGAITLRKLIENTWHLKCKVYGLVAGTCSGSSLDNEATAVEFASGRLVSYLFSASNNRDIWKIHDAAKGHNMIIELLLSSSNPSFRGFKKDNYGNYSFNKVVENIDAVEIQKGILEFATFYIKHPFGNLIISGRDAAAPIALLYENEQYIRNVLKKSGIRANVE